jgi:type I restriction enzyme S subunit
VKFKLETEFQDTEIGKVPKDWKIVKLKDVAEVRGSKKVPQGVDKVVFIPMEAIPEDGIYTKFELRDINEVKSYVYCEPGDILLAKITPSFENGKQGIVPLEIPQKFALATTEVYPIKGKKIDIFILFYLLKYPLIRDGLISLMRGTTGRKRVPREALENQWIPLPPTEEQKKISEILLTVDKTIENVGNAIARLNGLKKALMRELLTGRIRVREENSKLFFYRETEFQETEIGKIPREWKVIRLRAISTFAKRGKTPKYGKSELLVIKTAHNYPDGIKFEEAPHASEEFLANLPKEFYLKPGDILINSTGTGSVGRVGFFDGYHKPCTVDGHITILRIDQKLGVPKYVFYYLSSPSGQSALLTKASGSTHQVELYVNEILDLAFPLPSLEEQQKIIEILSTVDGAIELYREERVRLDRLKRGLMDLLLTGRVRVWED